MMDFNVFDYLLISGSSCSQQNAVILSGKKITKDSSLTATNEYILCQVKHHFTITSIHLILGNRSIHLICSEWRKAVDFIAIINLHCSGKIHDLINLQKRYKRNNSTHLIYSEQRRATKIKTIINFQCSGTNGKIQNSFICMNCEKW